MPEVKEQQPDWIMEIAVTLTKHLQGKTIAVVRYTTEEEEKHLGFKHKAPLILFTDDTIMIACSRGKKAEAGEFITNIDGIRSIPSL
tara:strand:- start:489 stop:749 length:261 start_codon:yes stop_codon:yes gene_type:complete